MQEISEQDRKYLETNGVENTRIALLTNTNLALADRGVAWRWLKEQDERITSQKSFYERTNLKVTTIGTIAAIVAAVASVWALIK